MAERKFTISGPGAADFLAATGGEDLPGSSSSKGMGQTRDEGSTLTDARNLVPRFGPDTEAQPGERASTTDQETAPDQRTGSQTGTIGGGGVEAHNPDPVRATGVDDPTTGERSTKKRTTKKY